MTPLRKAARRRQRVVAALLLLAYLPACTTWQIGTPTPAQFVEREHPKTIRVTRSDSTTLTMRDPVVRDDSLVGLVAQGAAPRDTMAAVSLALADVQSVSAKRTSTSTTILAIAGVALVVAVVGLIAECSGKSGLSAIGCP